MKKYILILVLLFNACKEKEKTTIFIETYHKDSLHSREGHSYFDGIEISKGKYIFKQPDYGHEDSVIIIIGNDYKNPPVIRGDKTFNNAVFESAPQETDTIYATIEWTDGKRLTKADRILFIDTTLTQADLDSFFWRTFVDDTLTSEQAKGDSIAILEAIKSAEKLYQYNKK